MNNLLSKIAIITVALMAISCSKDFITPEELFKDSSKEAKTFIHFKSDESETSVTTFSQVAVYRNSEEEGKSWFSGWSGGRMVHDSFFLSFYFDNVEKMKVGDALKISHFLFSFPLSSSHDATTQTYSGKITLAGKGDDYVILHFHNLGFSCSFGEYLTNGYLYCPLFDEFNYELP